MKIVLRVALASARFSRLTSTPSLDPYWRLGESLEPAACAVRSSLFRLSAGARFSPGRMVGKALDKGLE